MQIPSQLIRSLIGLKGFNQQSFQEVHTSGEQVTSIRFNPLKNSIVNNEWVIKKNFSMTDERLQTPGSQLQPPDTLLPAPDSRLPAPHSLHLAIGSQLPTLSPVPWSTKGFYLNHRPSFTFDPLLHAGCYYVQEASSMFLEEAFKQTVDISTDLKILDLCAAPGGKSTLLQSIISPSSLLVSNDVIKSRSGILEETMTKWGGANVIVTNNDPKDFARLENFFDVVVVDAPCSGSGLFRRDPSAIDEWSGQNVQGCCQRQQRILADVWPALKKDGILIYSTCSYSKEENEDILDWVTENLPAVPCKLSMNAEWGIVETISVKHAVPGYRFWPDKVKGEGFFIACFRKMDGGNYSQRIAKKSKIELVNKSEEALIFPWLKKDIPVQLIKFAESILALPRGIDHDFLLLTMHSFYIRQAGIRIGKIAGKDLIPDHALAVSNIINEELVAVSLNHQEAIQYLRREEVQVNNSNSIEGKSAMKRQGWTLVKYEGINLGWIKILQNRINNYYPKEWRILKK